MVCQGCCTSSRTVGPSVYHPDVPSLGCFPANTALGSQLLTVASAGSCQSSHCFHQPELSHCNSVRTMSLFPLIFPQTSWNSTGVNVDAVAPWQYWLGMSLDLSEYTNVYKAFIRCSLRLCIPLAVLQRGMALIGACWVPSLFFREQIKVGIIN